MYLDVSSLLESVIMLPYVSRCISIVFVCVCVCVCVCAVCVCVCVCVCASDVLKNCTVLFAQPIHMHKGV